MNYYRKTVGFLASSRIGRVMMLGIVAMLAFSLLADAANQRRGARVKSIVVESAASSEKAITAFSFTSLDPDVTGTITGTNIALTVPYGTAVTNLVSTFTVSAGATVKVGSTAQTSGTTANDFSSPTTYTVTAADGTTQNYTVTVTVSLAGITGKSIGDSFGGGKIAYILAAGESIGYIDANGVAQVQAYDADVQHGLIAATDDHSEATTWSNITTVAIGPTAQGTAIGTGASNTLAIIDQSDYTGSAAMVCADYSVIDGGTTYDDWYLPSKDELNKLYEKKGAVGGFVAYYYWSSSESNASYAWYQSFDSGYQSVTNKGANGRVRAVRAF
ncbi:MAG: DUF1566 domain-containing protein [Chlorobium phaeovibrioides]|nr:DUF1566 domain-containing protein [Chlorobium phaeovibrioides]